MTAVECLNQICPDTLNLILNQKGTHYYLAKAMREYAKIKCKEQRDICAEHAGLEPNGMMLQVDKESIINSPEPNFD